MINKEKSFKRVDVLPVLDKEQLIQIANQLRCPSGEEGVAMGELLNKSNISMIEQSIKALNLEDKNRVLELGHGSCTHLSDLLKEAIGLTYFGMEISEVMKTEAERINKSYINKRKALFQIYDGINIPYVSNIFDRIVTVNTICFLENPLLFLEEMYRVLKRGGKFVLTFAKASFMENLPFVINSNLFKLYEDIDIKRLMNKTKFDLNLIESKTERVLSKTGELVNREYFIIVLSKKQRVVVE